MVNAFGGGINGVRNSVTGAPHHDDEVALVQENRGGLVADMHETPASMRIVKPGHVLEGRHVDTPGRRKGCPKIERSRQLLCPEYVAEQIQSGAFCEE